MTILISSNASTGILEVERSERSQSKIKGVRGSRVTYGDELDAHGPSRDSRRGPTVLEAG